MTATTDLQILGAKLAGAGRTIPFNSFQKTKVKRIRCG